MDFLDRVPKFYKVFGLIFAFAFMLFVISEVGFIGAIGALSIIGLMLGFVLFAVKGSGGTNQRGQMSLDSYEDNGEMQNKQKLLGSIESKVESEEITTRFSDVAGCDEAKEELMEFVEFLRDPSRFQKLGAQMPRGALLMGPPGTGKTLLARALAGEAGASFHSVKGSEFVEMFVGVGASRVRDLFDEARRNAPSIIFIDEIDAVGRQRGAGVGNSHDEREQTLNELLAQMDGFDELSNVVVIAATNRPDVLDSALLERFVRRVTVPLPDLENREKILKVHIRGKEVSSNVDIAEIARDTAGFSGRLLRDVANEAAIFAARRGAENISQKDFEEAGEKVLIGPGTKHMMNERDKKITAHHEAGHAVTAAFHEHAGMPRKISILPRGMSGGHTQVGDEEEIIYQSREQILGQMAYMYGGRVAEEIFLNIITTSASDDIKKATSLASKFVTQWGMSESIGARNVSFEENHPFLGRSIAQNKPISEETLANIDSAVAQLLEDAQRVARDLLEEHKESVEALVALLLEKETLGVEEINKALGFKSPK